MRKIDPSSPEYDFVRQLLENVKCVLWIIYPASDVVQQLTRLLHYDVTRNAPHEIAESLLR